LAIEDIPRIILTLEEDHLAKGDAKCVLSYLKNVLKLKVGMITGDNKHTALKVAKYLSIPIENVSYRANPNDKKKTVMSY
jgi:Cu+-exporting ATPase